MDGLIVVNKEEGMSSFQMVRQVGKLFGTKKVGHLGTLDPLATGVLVVAIGKGTKVIEYLDKSEKEYLATVKMGIETDTLDITGHILKESSFLPPSKDGLGQVLSKFVGTYLQEVPLYSAVHVKGKRLYQYARDNKEVLLPKREVSVNDLTLVAYEEGTFTFQCSVSKGTYIRSLIRDIGRELDIPCTMKALKRLRQGTFCLEDASTLEELKQGKYRLVSIAEALSDIPRVQVEDSLVLKIKNGCKLPKCFDGKKALLLDSGGNSLAIYQEDPNNPSWMRVFKML